MLFWIHTWTSTKVGKENPFFCFCSLASILRCHQETYRSTVSHERRCDIILRMCEYECVLISWQHLLSHLIAHKDRCCFLMQNRQALVWQRKKTERGREFERIKWLQVSFWKMCCADFFHLHVSNRKTEPFERWFTKKCILELNKMTGEKK